ncbi:hypothetical protein E2562_031970 [Oryza meyeriana var. granulata]|uniref:Uncharacterized protein n=1 Tax=Oryza meyeriana var. granulata TaxID=110450 RepID=A0A6G1F0F8_9ORYZ|nr:hypothetical protein E2562_031970 [Oryza meyeriana var. granulata]
MSLKTLPHSSKSPNFVRIGQACLGAKSRSRQYGAQRTKDTLHKITRGHPPGRLELLESKTIASSSSPSSSAPASLTLPVASGSLAAEATGIASGGLGPMLRSTATAWARPLISPWTDFAAPHSPPESTPSPAPVEVGVVANEALEDVLHHCRNRET